MKEASKASSKASPALITKATKTNSSLNRLQANPSDGTSPLPRRRALRLKAGAEYLSISPWKLRELVLAGEIPVVQHLEGSPYQLDVRDLDAWLDRNKRIGPR